MDNDLGAMLESVLSDPAQMNKIVNMAQSLFGDTKQDLDSRINANSETDNESSGKADRISNPFLTLGKVFGSNHPKSRSTQLLLAMRPYMRPEKQEKLDKAIKIAEIVHIAGFVMKEYGGDFFGSI